MCGFGKDVMELHDIAAVWCVVENPPVKDLAEDGKLALGQGWYATPRKFEMEW